MKNCLGCKYAEWKMTKDGKKLHPSGDGDCKYPWKLPPLPQSMRLFYSAAPSGGYINRRGEFQDHCVYYQKESA